MYMYIIFAPIGHYYYNSIYIVIVLGLPICCYSSIPSDLSVANDKNNWEYNKKLR